MNCDKQRILITGVGGEFGGVLARRFRDIGYIVAGTDVMEHNKIPDELSVLLQHYWQIDLGNAETTEKGFRQIFTEYLPDILVNNAGQKVFNELSAFSSEQIRSVATVNLIAPMIITKLWQDAWYTSGHGKIVNILISSNAAYRGYIKGSVYCGSKSGLRTFGEAMIEENAGNNVQTVVVCPETFSTAKRGNRLTFSADDVFDKVYQAILTGKSLEIPILSPKSRVRYLIQNFLRNMRWVIYGQ